MREDPLWVGHEFDGNVGIKLDEVLEVDDERLGSFRRQVAQALSVLVAAVFLERVEKFFHARSYTWLVPRKQRKKVVARAI